MADPIARYCDPIAAIPHIARYVLREVSTPPKSVRYPLFVLSFTQAHLCDTPFCNVSRDNCAIPHKQARKTFAILSLQVSRDMKSIAAGPLSVFLELRPTTPNTFLGEVLWEEKDQNIEFWAGCSWDVRAPALGYPCRIAPLSVVLTGNGWDVPWVQIWARTWGSYQATFEHDKQQLSWTFGFISNGFLPSSPTFLCNLVGR